MKWTKEAVEEGIDPIKIADTLVAAIREVGDSFGRGDIFLVELVMAADAIKSAMPIVQEEMNKSGKERKSLGTIVIGTVLGDIHDIGKTLVATLLLANGFEVKDIGIDVPAEKFTQSIREYHPQVLAMSALLTVTAPEQGKVISALKREGIRDQVKIMVGGGAITKEFADEIGADGYESTAPDAVKLAEKLVQK
jgi:corrinoid protein of di/trimethylamine methyltransferase